MSTEQRVFVKIPEAARDAVMQLDRRSDAALARARKAPLGDRTDILRFERLQTELELLATVAMNDGVPTVRDDATSAVEWGSCLVKSIPEDMDGHAATQVRQWLDESAMVIVRASPFVIGRTVAPEGLGVVTPVAEIWKSKTKAQGKDAVYERFTDQLEAAVMPNAKGAPSICPSGIPNTTLTNALRTFAMKSLSRSEIEVPVVYRDGSTARPFPLRCLALVNNSLPIGRVVSVSLLSIRHVDLDSEVDGAWLRNSEVSRPRPAADTDEFVYQESVKQLDRLCDEAPMTLIMYQTGLETAIVGFYRAVVERLIAQPDRLSVRPMFYQERGPYRAGETWRVA